MERLTTDNPKDDLESARNLFYIKNGETWVLGGGPEPDYKDVTLYDFIRRITKIHDLNISTDDNEAMRDHLYDLLFDSVDSIEGVVALLYTAAWAFSELREKLKAYEDMGLEPEEIAALVKAREEGLFLKFPCKAGEIVYYVLPDCGEYMGFFVSEPHRVTEVGTRGFWTSAIPDDEPEAMNDFTPWSDFGKTVFLTRAEAEAAIGGGGDS